MTRRLGWTAIVILLAAPVPLPLHAAAQQSTLGQALHQDQGNPKKDEKGTETPPTAMEQVLASVVRIPIAGALGTVLAVRPRRRGTPARQPAVIQTQIILAIVGAVVMMIVGSNLARAFGIVGAAGLVRYRAKIEDPKDAGVMLTTLAVGLASGVGLFAMAAASTVFILLTLWVIESFERDTGRVFDLKIRMGDDTDGQRAQFEAILKRFHVKFDLRAASDDEVTYEVLAPLELSRDRVSNAILKLDPEGHAAVDWSEKKLKAK